MAARTSLRKPPIQEAILDVAFSDSKLNRKGLDRLALEYPTSDWIHETITETRFEAQIDASGNAARSTTSSSFDGYAFRELTGRRIVQIREDRLTCSHFAHYSTWEELASDFEHAFDLFVAEGKPTQVERLATRFVNRIPMPDSFDDLLTIPPRTLPNLGDAQVTDFSRRQLIQGLREGFQAILTVATMTPLPEETHKALLIDIDVFKKGGWEPTFSTFLDQLEALRDIKNAIFFESVTDLALEPCK